MVEIRQSTVIDAPIDEVWDILRDFNGHDRWHPAVATSVIEDGIRPDIIGAVRDFRLADGSRIKEQLLALSDCDRSFTYCILEAPLPLMGYVATVRLMPVTDGNRTFWQWRSRFDPPQSQRDRLVKLVSEDIYEAGFRAIKALLSGAPATQTITRTPVPAIFTPTSGTPAQAIVIDRHGGPEMLSHRTIHVPQPGPGELRIRQRAIGVNFIDVYCRTGYFDLIALPGIPGMEAAGIVESIGSGVSGFGLGERVGYASPPPGAYTDLRNMRADLLIRLPDDLSDDLAAATLLKGISASFLLHDVYAVKPGDTILVHAAAGGVGLLLTQWAVNIGATVIGTTSTEEKAARVRKAGATHVVLYTQEDFADAVLRLTRGRGADAVYDAIGRTTFEGSLRTLKPKGHLISFGQASGDIGEYGIGGLAAKSATLSRPNYAHYTETRDLIRLHSDRLFAAIRGGAVTPDPPTRYPLSQAAAAHADLESRKTSGSLILLP